MIADTTRIRSDNWRNNYKMSMSSPDKIVKKTKSKLKSSLDHELAMLVQDKLRVIANTK